MKTRTQGRTAAGWRLAQGWRLAELISVGMVCLVFTSCRAPGRGGEQNAATAIRAVLDEQVRAWNDGDLGKFMEGYHKSETMRFASGGNVTLGWQGALDRYRTNYSDRAAMGRLAFSDIDITVASPDAALVFGRWRLEREKDAPTGLFTLLFRTTSQGWRIVHDHTSAAK